MVLTCVRRAEGYLRERAKSAEFRAEVGVHAESAVQRTSASGLGETCWLNVVVRGKEGGAYSRAIHHGCLASQRCA